jgi:hypothetical protein
VEARIQQRRTRRDDVIHALRDAHARDDDALELGLQGLELRRHLQRAARRCPPLLREMPARGHKRHDARRAGDLAQYPTHGGAIASSKALSAPWVAGMAFLST